jgi:hypothetical protein
MTFPFVLKTNSVERSIGDEGGLVKGQEKNNANKFLTDVPRIVYAASR